MTPKKLPRNEPGDLNEGMERQAHATGLLDQELITAIAEDPEALSASTGAALKARPGKFGKADVQEQLRSIAKDIACSTMLPSED